MTPEPPSPTPAPDEADPLRRALGLLRAHKRGVLLADERPHPWRGILHGRTGRPIGPVAPEVLDAVEHVLFLPDENEDALQVLVHPREIDPRSEPACDRWEALHVAAREARWVMLAIESARLGGAVLSGEALEVPNPLHDAEPALCRLANADRARLGAMVSRARASDTLDAVLVGVDPEGLDVRHRTGLARVAFPRVAPTPDAARDALRGLLGLAGDRA